MGLSLMVTVPSLFFELVWGGIQCLVEGIMSRLLWCKKGPYRVFYKPVRVDIKLVDIYALRT